MKITEETLRKFVREQIKTVLNEQKQYRMEFTRGYVTVGEAGADVKHRAGGDVRVRLTLDGKVAYLNDDDVTRLINALQEFQS